MHRRYRLWLLRNRVKGVLHCFEPVQECEGVGLAGHLARSVAAYCLGDGDIPSRPFHKPVLECNRGQHSILVPCRRSLSPGLCAATERSGARRRTLPQELGARPIQSSKAKAVLDSWDGLRLISCLAGVRPLSTKSGFRLDDGEAGSNPSRPDSPHYFRVDDHSSRNVGFAAHR
jgi:hypothetical protein